MNAQQKPARSVSVRLRILLAVLLPVFLVVMTVSIAIVDYTQSQGFTYLENTVEIYVNEISRTLANVNRRIRTLLLGSSQESLAAASYMETIQSSGNQAYVNHSIRQLKLMFTDIGQEYGTNMNFFLYIGSKDFYIRCTDGYMAQREYRQYEESLSEILSEDMLRANTGIRNWKEFKTENGEHALVRLYRKNDVYMGCWLRAEDMIAPLNRLAIGQNDLLTVCNEQYEFLTAQDQVAALGLDLENLSDGLHYANGNIFKSQLIITRRLNGLPYMVKLLILNYGTFQNLLYIEVGLVLLTAAVFTCLLGMVYYLQRRLLKPLRNFSRSLQQIEAGYGNIECLSRNDLQELDEANAEFAKLLNEVERLKMAVNTQTLEKQAVQMDYLKMQIKPHFYLNCLNFIYNMIDLGEYENARKMSRVTSDYLRYLLRNGEDLVTLAEEMEHVCKYMEIQKMRYNNAVQFHAELDDSVQGTLLPPMVVQTFVENTIKHALNMDKKVSITVCTKSVMHEGHPRVGISITDNGDGFDPDTLQTLVTQGGMRGKDGHGVGIDNCMKRLYYYYGSKASVEFANGVEGGAFVQIYLPVTPTFIRK